MFNPNLKLRVSTALLVLAGAAVSEMSHWQDVAEHATEVLNAHKSNMTEGAETSTLPGVLLCANSHFVDPCSYIARIQPGACYFLGPFFYNTLSSILPEPGLKCYGYLNSDCTPAHPNLGPITFPGIEAKEQFTQDGIDYHDRVNGIVCWNA